jgi:arsenite methyltransferase
MAKKAYYGLDAPDILKRWSVYGAFAVIGMIGSTIYLSGWIGTVASLIFTGASLMFLMPVLTIPLGSFIFKFWDREWLFRNLDLQGTERVLDLGCGHGLLLIGAAKRLTSGRAHGLDLWAQADQASNSQEATMENARLEGVAGKIEIHSGDMRKMPFPDCHFDAAVSSWAIHNIYDQAERETALAEIARVLKPGGKLAILDIDHAPSYGAFFKSKNFKDVKLLGPHFTFGNRTYLVLAMK